MKRLLLIVGALMAIGSSPANAATICVGASPGCFASVQPAVTAAHDGDTITIAAGTFPGGILIDKSVALKGAGAGATILKGGGPVLVIFRATAPAQLSVSIDGITVTGGVNNSYPDQQVTFGGGIWIPVEQLSAPPFNGPGATVAISNSVITGNTVRSDSIIPPGGFCGPLPCGFNAGGGIDNGGTLTLTNVRVTNNLSGSSSTLASVASGVSAGGIVNRTPASLSLKNVIVSGNRAIATPPNGQFAEAGGISSNGALTIDNSIISDNSAELSGNLGGSDADQSALAGGLHVCCEATPTVTVTRTLISGNRAIATGTGSDAIVAAFAGGVLAEAPLLMEHTITRDNLVHANATAGDAVADGGGLEVDSRVTIRDSLVSQNTVLAEAARGALALGGGIADSGQLTLERTLVSNNRISTNGTNPQFVPFGFPSGSFGGGVFVGSFGGPEPPQLSVTDSIILGNRAVATPGFLVQGGGLFTSVPVTRVRTLIAFNRPDQCFGC